jgi:endonuclease/exonuclease/phosphatase family metal-dependent hydrolase
VVKGFNTKVAELEEYFEKEQYDVVALQEVTDHVPGPQHYKTFYPKTPDKDKDNYGWRGRSGPQ